MHSLGRICLILAFIGCAFGLSVSRDVKNIKKNPCLLPVEVGPCEAIYPRFFHNTATGWCEPFTYGGCDGNANNFETIEECQDMCTNGQGPPVDPCSLPAEVGPCEAIYPRFFHNTATGLCESFTYGGCEGNANNFETIQDCQLMCTGGLIETTTIPPEVEVESE